MIPDGNLIACLQGDLTRKSHSLAEYMAASSPYVAAGQEKMWQMLLKLRAQEQEHAQRLSRLIVSLGGVPSPGLFDAGVADMNYLGIAYLYQLLIRSKKESIVVLGRRLEQARGNHGAVVVIGDILDAEKRQLAELESCLAAHRPKPRTTVAPAAGPPVVTAPPPPKAEGAKPKFDLQAYLTAHKGAPIRKESPAKREGDAPKPVEGQAGVAQEGQPKPKFDLQAFLAAKKSQAAGKTDAPVAADKQDSEKSAPGETSTPPGKDTPRPTEKKPFDLQAWLKIREKKE